MSDHGVFEALQEVSARPNYEGRCMVCGNTPTVQICELGTYKVINETDLCGPCCFGTAEALDVETW